MGIGHQLPARRGWKVPVQTIATAAAQTQEVLAFLTRVHRRDAGGELQVSYNDPDFDIAVACHGGQQPVLPATTRPSALPKSDIENEEAAAFLGLKDFLRGLIADRKSVDQRNGRLRIRLL